MKREIADKWTEALRSGEYKQACGALAISERTEHCCLGVLCEMAIKDGVEIQVTQSHGRKLFDGIDNDLPFRVRRWAGMATALGEFDGGALVSLNDAGTPFESIADVIEQHWEEL